MAAHCIVLTEASDSEEVPATPKPVECPPVPEVPVTVMETAEESSPAALVDTLVPEKEAGSSSSSSSSGEVGSADPTDVDDMIPGMRGDGLDYIQELMATEQHISMTKDAEALTPEPPDLMAAMNEILSSSEERPGLQDYPGLLEVDKDPPSGTESPSSTGSGRSRSRRSKDLLKGKRRSEIMFAADSMDSASSSQEEEPVELPVAEDTPVTEEQPAVEPLVPEPVISEPPLEEPVKEEEPKEEVKEEVKEEPSPMPEEPAVVEAKEEESEDSVEGDVERKRRKKGKKKSEVKVEEEVMATECSEPPVLEAQTPMATTEVPVETPQPVEELPEPELPPQDMQVKEEATEEEEPQEEPAAPSQPEEPAPVIEAPVKEEEPASLPPPPTELPPAAPSTAVSIEDQEPEQIQAAHNLLSVMAAPPQAAPALVGDTPPETPENSPPRADSPQTSPYQQQEEDGEEEELLGQPTVPVGSESPGNCDMSTISNSSVGSSGNVPSCESSGETALKRKHEPEYQPPHASKRRKRGLKRTSVSEKSKPTSKTTPTGKVQ